MSRSRSTIFELIPFDDKCKNLQNTLTYFVLAPTFSEFRDITITSLVLQKVGQVHGVQFSQTKCQNLQKTPTHICAYSYSFRGKFFNHQNQGHGIQFSK